MSLTAQELQEIVTAIRSVAEIQKIFTYQAQNAIIVRGEADKVALAEKMVADLDKPKSEVVVDVLVIAGEPGAGARPGCGRRAQWDQFADLFHAAVEHFSARHHYNYTNHRHWRHNHDSQHPHIGVHSSLEYWAYQHARFFADPAWRPARSGAQRHQQQGAAIAAGARGGWL